MSSEPKLIGSAFGQSDPTDGRERLDWETKYPPKAVSAIRFEAWYLGFLLLLAPVALLVLWAGWPQCRLGLSDQKYHVAMKFGLAWAAGTLGGILFDIKWLYHSVARQLWHIDRRLWRVFTPHLSGGLAFFVIVLIESHIFTIFDRNITNRSVTVVGIALLTGYFSDSAVAKLSEIAETLFGTTRSKEKHKETTSDKNKDDRSRNH